MAEEERKYDFEVLRVEKGDGNKYKFVFNSEIGEYPLELGEEYYNLFKPGEKYWGFGILSGVPDFLGDEDKMENVCTVTFCLEKLLDGEQVVWKK